MLMDISGDSKVMRFLEILLSKLAGWRNIFIIGKGYISLGPLRMVASNIIGYIIGILMLIIL